MPVAATAAPAPLMAPRVRSNSVASRDRVTYNWEHTVPTRTRADGKLERRAVSPQLPAVIKLRGFRVMARRDGWLLTCCDRSGKKAS